MKKKIIRLIVLLFVMCSFALSDRGTSAAETGSTPKTAEWKAGAWKSVSVNGVTKYWWRYAEDGSYPTNCWLKIQGKYYYFESDGYMATDSYWEGFYVNKDGQWVEGRSGGRWHPVGKKWYYKDDSGYWPQNGWLRINGKEFHFDAEGYLDVSKWIDNFHYVDSDGIYLEGIVKLTGFKLTASRTTITPLDDPLTISATPNYCLGSESITKTEKFNWSSDNTSVATVSENGVVTAKAEGKAKITIASEYSEVSSSISISVVKAKFKYGPEKVCTENDTVYMWPGYQFTISQTNVTANTSNLTWESSDSSVKCQNLTSGKATIKAPDTITSKKTINVSLKNVNGSKQSVKVVLLPTTEKADSSFSFGLYKDEKCTSEFNPSTDKIGQFGSLYVGVIKNGSVIPIPKGQKTIYTGSGFVMLSVKADGEAAPSSDGGQLVFEQTGSTEIKIGAVGVSGISKEVSISIEDNIDLIAVEVGTTAVVNDEKVFKSIASIASSGTTDVTYKTNNRVLMVFAYSGKVAVDNKGVELSAITSIQSKPRVKYYLIKPNKTGTYKVTVTNASGKKFNFNIKVQPPKNGWATNKAGKSNYYENGKMVTGWRKIDKKMYYFDKSGNMVNGWQNIDGKWNYFSKGVRVTGWLQIGGKWYYLNPSMKTGWQKVGGKWYFFGTDGVMRSGWQKIGTKWYFFAGGAMKVGWMKSGGSWYYFGTDGAMVTGTKVIGSKAYRFNASGICLNP